jgi:hypothetical protein
MLQLLAGTPPDPFLVQGSHKTVYPCTLPRWLPKDVVQTLVDEYGIQLKGILRKYSEDTTGNRLRKHSSESELMSPHSSDGEHEDDDLEELMNLGYLEVDYSGSE